MQNLLLSTYKRKLKTRALLKIFSVFLFFVSLALFLYSIVYILFYSIILQNKNVLFDKNDALEMQINTLQDISNTISLQEYSELADIVKFQDNFVPVSIYDSIKALLTKNNTKLKSLHIFVDDNKKVTISAEAITNNRKSIADTLESLKSNLWQKADVSIPLESIKRNEGLFIFNINIVYEI